MPESALTPFRPLLHTPRVTLTVELGVAELAATRFAISPLSETVSSLQQLAGHERQASNLSWLDWATGELAREPLDLTFTWPLVASNRPSWPSFLVPAPGTSGSSIDDDLTALQLTSASQVRASLQRIFGHDLPEAVVALADRPAAGLRGIAAELRAAYDRLIGPHWPRIRAVLDADVAHRARQLATGGAGELLTNLHPELRWCDGRLIRKESARLPQSIVSRGPGGLVLIPVALGPPRVLIKKNTSTQTTVRYPARGTGTLWTAGTQDSPAGTVRLLGQVRAELLEALRSPATTTALAHALGVTPSAVSQHLRVLHETGLVARQRVGRTVLYQTTALGLALIAPSR